MSLIVDAKGEHITTDILITGFIHDTTNNNDIIIPNEIIGIIFAFWFIDTCDKWDKSLCHETVNIAGQCVKLKKDNMCSIFGTKSVEKDVFEWRLRYKTRVRCEIGIIEDDIEILTTYQTSSGYMYTSNGLALMVHAGRLSLGTLFDIDRRYSDPTVAKGTLITLTLNMNDKTVAFKINDKQYGTKKIFYPKNKYRLAVSIQFADMELELL